MKAINPPDSDSGTEQPLVSHLLELRDRLLRMVVAVFAVFLLLFPFANGIYEQVAKPLMSRLPKGTSMIATEVASPFLTPFKLTLVAALFVAMPYVLYQLWAFVAPGLYQHEKRLAMPLLASSVVLFYLGMAFAYYVVFPLVFAFFTSAAPEGVAVMTDINHYLDFVLRLFFAFGVAFEVPIAAILLVWMGMTTPEKLAEKRPYVIVAAFVIGMLLTPPDMISQTLLAVPMWILFELGILFSRIFSPTDQDAAGDPLGDEAAAGGAPSSAGQATGSASHDDSVSVGAEISGGDPNDPERFVPMTEEEMEAELNSIDAQDLGPADGSTPSTGTLQGAEAKLRRVQELRDQEDERSARRLLYEVLEEGDAQQRKVARNILDQLDTA